MTFDPALVPTVPVDSFRDECAAEALSKECDMVSLGPLPSHIANWWFGGAVDLVTEHGVLLIGHVTDAEGFAPERCANVRKYFPSRTERANADTR